MKILHIYTGLLLLASSVSWAEHLTLKDGSLLRDAVVSRQGIDHVIVRHAGGVKRVDYDELTIDLQKRYNMTPREVKERLALQQEKADDERDRKEREKQRHLKLLKDSGQLPRYMSSADVRRLFLYYGELSEVSAEYLAAEWNKRESMRLDLHEETKRYESFAALVRETFDEEKAAALKSQARLSRQADRVQELQQQLKLAQQREAGWKEKEEKYKERLEEFDKEYRELWRDYERERNANRIHVVPGAPIYIPGRTNRGRTISF